MTISSRARTLFSLNSFVGDASRVGIISELIAPQPILGTGSRGGEGGFVSVPGSASKNASFLAGALRGGPVAHKTNEFSYLNYPLVQNFLDRGIILTRSRDNFDATEG